MGEPRRVRKGVLLLWAFNGMRPDAVSVPRFHRALDFTLNATGSASSHFARTMRVFRAGKAEA